jgi:hypothetical protein
VLGESLESGGKEQCIIHLCILEGFFFVGIDVFNNLIYVVISGPTLITFEHFETF